MHLSPITGGKISLHNIKIMYREQVLNCCTKGKRKKCIINKKSKKKKMLKSLDGPKIMKEKHKVHNMCMNSLL